MSYKFDHAWKQERERLAQIEAAYDPWTKRVIEATPPQEGWRCLEIGAGGGSVAEWLCERVGKRGRVTATDLETKFLEMISSDNLEIRRHDIVSDALEEDAYDLVHSRAVLDHLPERDEIIPKLVAALKPGGWLIVESGDFSSVGGVGLSSEESEFFRRGFQTVVSSGAEGFEPAFGRRLGDALRAAGLERVVLEGFVTEWTAGSATGQLYQLTFQRLQKQVLEKGALSPAEFDRLLNLMQSPDFRAIGHTVFSARGQRPAA